MPEGLKSIINTGFNIWRNNLKIGVPFLLESIIDFVLALIFIFVLALLIFSSFINPLDITSSLSSLSALGIGTIIAILFCVILFILLISLISAFFHAGAIGMSKTAIESGKTKLSDMMSYGKRKFISLFLADIIVTIIQFAGVFLLIGVPALVIFLLKSIPKIISLTFLIIGVILAGIYLIAAGIVFSLVPYSVVISDLGAVKGVKNAFGVFMKNKLDVFVLCLLIFIITIAVGICQVALGFFIGAINLIMNSAISSLLFSILRWIVDIVFWLISIVIILPLTTVWWSKLYMDRTGVDKG